jgi:hypothetical protein
LLDEGDDHVRVVGVNVEVAPQPRRRTPVPRHGPGGESRSGRQMRQTRADVGWYHGQDVAALARRRIAVGIG